MMHPVGPRPPAVYWRRRVLLACSGLAILVMLVITVKVVLSDKGSAKAATPPTHVAKTSGASSLSTPPSSPSTPTTSTSSQPASPTSTPPGRCVSSQLAIAAVTGKSTYRVGERLLIELQVTNDGAVPCVQDLADSQVVLLVYNGASRVWGSHDCKIQPGHNDRTLDPHASVRVAIDWAGMSSRPNCAGTRLRVGAGSYTLYAELSGKRGKAAQFTIG